MKIYKDYDLSDFEFWGGAVDRAKYFAYDDFVTIEWVLEDLYPNGLDETTINDIFWFEEDFLAQIFCYETFEELVADREEMAV